MFNAKKIVATVAVFGAGFAAFSTSSAVQAEPVSNSYSIVGSDTLEDVVNAIVNGTAITGSTVRVTQNGATLGSFDATGSAYIITKPGGPRFSRPNGSGEGFQALSASIGEVGVDSALTVIQNVFTSGTYQNLGENSVSTTAMPNGLRNVNVSGQVDIARSSSGDPKNTAIGGLKSDGVTANGVTDATATLARVPFARDAIALAFAPALADAVCAAEGQGTLALGTCVPYLDAAQLKSLYETTSANPTLTIGTGANQATIAFNPVIPQAGSGTRKDFLIKIGSSSAAGTESNAFGTASSTTNQFVRTGQEHDAISAAFIAAGNSAIEPMSASRWIAMKNKASFDKSGTAVIGAVYTATTLGASPVTGTAPALAPNAAYYADSTWGRNVYLYVERARIDATFTAGGTITAGSRLDANLVALLDPTLNTLSNTQTTGASKVGKVKLLFGFLAPTSTTIVYYGPSYAGVKSLQ